MAFVISDRIKMTTTTTGTGTVTLGSAITGFSDFSPIGNANTTGYCIYGVDANGVPTGEWETGIGTYTSSGTTLSRGVIKSSNANALVSFSAGTKHVIVCDIANYLTPIVMATTTNKAIQIADQTMFSSTAGNARGKGAVDLQSRRSSAAQVASGDYSVQCGGWKNTTSNAYGFTGGGNSNSNTASRGVIAGGGYNTAQTGSYPTVGGGSNNTASGNRATVAGGSTNAATSNYSTVAGGRNNTAQTKADATICGGRANICSGTRAFVGAGYGNTASGDDSAVVCGNSCTASALYAMASGGAAKAIKTGQVAHSAGLFSSIADAQTSFFLLRKQTTDGTQTELFCDASTHRMVLTNDSTWGFNIFIVARRTDADNESALFNVQGAIDRNTNAASTAIVGSVTTTVLARDTAAWTVAVDADTTNGSLRIRVTGESSKTINWLAFVRTIEVIG